MLVKKEIMVVNSSEGKLHDKKDRDEIMHETFKNEWVEPLNGNIELS